MEGHEPDPPGDVAELLKPFVRDQRRPFLLAFLMLAFEAITSVE
jgi:hypothetical protein